MNEDFKDFDALLKGFVEGSLSESQQKKLEEILKNDSSARKRYLDYITVESMLGSHRVKVEHAEPMPAKPKLKILTQRTNKFKKKSSSRSRNSSTVLIFAASMFLVLGIGYYMKFIFKVDELSSMPVEVQDSFLAKIEKVSGDVKVIVDGIDQQVKEGFELISGSEIHSSKTAELNILLHDGSRLKLAPSSILIFSQVKDQFKLVFKEGFIKADINKQPPGKPMLISTASAQMTVLGTVLRVNLLEDSTTLTVDEGRVEIKNFQKQKVLVHSDESATAQPGKTMKVRSLKDYKVKKLEILSAFYGAEDKWIDLTPQVRSRAGNSRLILTGNFKSLAGDPNYGIVKSLKISYKIDGKKGTFTISEYTRDRVDPRFFTTEVILPLP